MAEKQLQSFKAFAAAPFLYGNGCWIRKRHDQNRVSRDEIFEISRV
jgi:hypothetical protein